MKRSHSEFVCPGDAAAKSAGSAVEPSRKKLQVAGQEEHVPGKGAPHVSAHVQEQGLVAAEESAVVHAVKSALPVFDHPVIRPETRTAEGAPSKSIGAAKATSSDIVDSKDVKPSSVALPRSQEHVQINAPSRTNGDPIQHLHSSGRKFMDPEADKRAETEKDRVELYRLSDSSFFAGHATDASSYTLQKINRAFKLASAAVFLTWVVLITVVYGFTPAKYFRRATDLEQRAASLGGGLLFVSVLAKCVPVFVRGWKNALSGVMIGVLTVQTIAMLTDFLMVFYPIPVRVDPITHLAVYLPRWCEFTPLAFMMCFLTEGVGLKDVTPGSPVWPMLKAPVLLSLAQSVSTFNGLVFPHCPGKISWGVAMSIAMVLYLFVFPSLHAKRQHFLSLPKGKNVHTREAYNRARLSYRLMALCTVVWSTLVVFYFLAWFAKKWGTEGFVLSHESTSFIFDTLFEAMSKVLYLHVIVDIHNVVFDEGKRASRVLEELRQMMSVVWECSSDVVAISVKGWNGTVTTMLSPTFLKLEGVEDKRVKAIVFEQEEQEFSNYILKKQMSEENGTNENIAELDLSKYGHSRRFGALERDKSKLNQEQELREGSLRRLYCMEFNAGRKICIRDPDVNSAIMPALDSIADLIVKSWTAGQDELLLMHDLIGRCNTTIQCEANVTKLESNALVVVVRDISERFKLFEAEKKAIFEITGE